LFTAYTYRIKDGLFIDGMDITSLLQTRIAGNIFESLIPQLFSNVTTAERGQEAVADFFVDGTYKGQMKSFIMKQNPLNKCRDAFYKGQLVGDRPEINVGFSGHFDKSERTVPRQDKIDKLFEYISKFDVYIIVDKTNVPKGEITFMAYPSRFIEDNVCDGYQDEPYNRISLIPYNTLYEACSQHIEL
jgi:hypothetical protein